MQKILLLTAILLISSCSMFVAGHLSDSNKDLYNLQDNLPDRSGEMPK